MTASRKTVTALRERRRGQVDVELDGTPWRTLPADAVARTGLLVGRALDRETARTLAREVRRAEALGVAVRALRFRDLSRARLEERLASRGAPAGARGEAIAALARTGIVDDARAAGSRAETLARLGYGDAAIRLELERDGFQGDTASEAIAALEPERDRARAFVERRGAGVRTARWLAARGFEGAAVEEAAGGFAVEP